ncbi:hypothetical protein KVP40.0232 [Vibrio phage KVP40]|uniref:Uncharacterized protein n=4 Tax=Schizotequatrovirus KVP40 TaxID=1914019 RepID=Q6WHS2_BPKVM|nr:hypothetical protein KVP40.0232 [Vibrio phage KVP40]AFN37462.1 hypothetical protein pp2_229 [Vibrio phage phi-pp2]QHJ74412.1 hypothetical protein VH12019_00085 [Vibrio phage VH1_2019]QIW90192.1 hypothetical protein OLCHANIL_00095 [Vibrio phage V05]QIW91182.1 hypothetical protein COHAPHLL_00346 [Vibrio phage V09]WOL24766.1 hypothetical protein [Vibrio phage PG216]
MITLSTNKEQLAIFCVLDSALSAPIMNFVETKTVLDMTVYHLVLSREDVLALAKAVEASDFDHEDEFGLIFNETMSELLFEIYEENDTESVHGIAL